MTNATQVTRAAVSPIVAAINPAKPQKTPRKAKVKTPAASPLAQSATSIHTPMTGEAKPSRFVFASDMLDKTSQGYQLMSSIAKHREELNAFFLTNKDHFVNKEGRCDIEKAFRWAFNVPANANKPEGGWKKIKMYVQFTNALTYWRNCYNAEAATADRIGGKASGSAPTTIDTVEKVEKTIQQLKDKAVTSFGSGMLNFIVHNFSRDELLAAYDRKHALESAAAESLQGEAIAPRDTSAKAKKAKAA